MKNSFFSQFAPQEPKFFAMLKKLSKSLVISSDLLVESVDYDTLEKREAYYKRIKEEERDGDTQAHLTNWEKHLLRLSTVKISII